MEVCCATGECVNKPSDVAFERHCQMPGRPGEGWKLKWTDPGPQVEVIHAVVPGPFDRPKILKALPYKLVSKCGPCAVPGRRRLQNGIPDPWLEYLDYDAWRKGQDDGEDSEEKNDVRHVKRCLKITDFVWQEKGLALLQGIPDPWKSDLPCECEIKTESKHKKRKSRGKESPRRRSSINERESPRRRSSMNEKESPRRRSTMTEEGTSSKTSSTNEEKTPRRRSSMNERESPKRRSTANEEEPPRRRSSMNEEEPLRRRRSTVNEEEPLRRRSSVNEEEPLRRRRSTVNEEEFPRRRSTMNEEEPPRRRRSTINEEEFPRRRSSNNREESTKRRSKNYDKEPIRRRSKSEEEPAKYAMCYAGEPSKTAYACYGGAVPACLSDYFVEECRKRRSKSVKRPSKKCDEEVVRRSSKQYDEEVPTKRRSKNYDEGPTKRRSGTYEDEIIRDCRQERPSKSKNNKKESAKRLSDTLSEDSCERFVEALKQSRKRSDPAKRKVDKEKASRSAKPKSSDRKDGAENTSKKSRPCGSGFDKVKQRLQELENELKAKEAAKDLKLREMEQLSKLKKKSCEGKKRSGRAREKFGKQKSSGWLGGPDETTDKTQSTRKESISPRGRCHVKGDERKTEEVKDPLPAKNSTRCNDKNVGCWLDEPGTHKKKLSKIPSKSPKKTEALNVSSRNTKEFKAPQTPIKSICKRPVTARAHSPQATTSTCTQPTTPRTRSPSPANPRRVSYTDEPQPTSRACSPYSANHRRVSYCDEPQAPASRKCSPYSRSYHQTPYVDEPVTPRSSLSKSPRGTSSTASQKESKESLKKFLDEINNRIEITQDALNSPDMKSVAVQPFRAETPRTWHCPGRDLCPRMRERAGGDDGPELFVRRIRVVGAAAKDDADLGAVSKFGEECVESFEASDASDCNTGADRDYPQRSYRGRSMADFKRRQKEIEELYVESFSDRDC